MAKGDLLGHINCPSCGTPGGMRITEDKNGSPFGYCEANCSQQMRVGGTPHRIAQFYKTYPHIKRPGAAEQAHQEQHQEQHQEKPPAPKAGGMAHALELLGVKA